MVNSASICMVLDCPGLSRTALTRPGQRGYPRICNSTDSYQDLPQPFCQSRLCRTKWHSATKTMFISAAWPPQESYFCNSACFCLIPALSEAPRPPSKATGGAIISGCMTSPVQHLMMNRHAPELHVSGCCHGTSAIRGVPAQEPHLPHATS